MLRLGWQQLLVVDQASLLFDPGVPAVGADIGMDALTPSAWQGRAFEAGFILATAAAGDL